MKTFTLTVRTADMPGSNERLSADESAAHELVKAAFKLFHHGCLKRAKLTVQNEDGSDFAGILDLGPFEH